MNERADVRAGSDLPRPRRRRFAPSPPPRLCRIRLDDSGYVVVYPMDDGGGVLAIEDGAGEVMSAAWCYPDPALAVAAATIWDGTDSPPEGWYQRCEGSRAPRQVTS